MWAEAFKLPLYARSQYVLAFRPVVQRTGSHCSTCAHSSPACRVPRSRVLVQSLATSSRAAADSAAAWATDHARTGQPEQALESGLYIVATPIGNLEDLTFRAVRILKSVSLILAEDTRHTQKLLHHYGIVTAVKSFHAHNEKAKQSGLVDRLRDGEPMALVSDAGTPAISDPGQELVAAAVAAGVRVVPVPGPCALIAALIASGLPTDDFRFVGFLAPKTAGRRQRLSELARVTSTLVLYVPPHGLRAALGDMVEVLGGQRRCCVSRELTKVHEEYFRSSLQGALEEFTAREPKGEICLVVEGAQADVASLSHAQINGMIEDMLLNNMPVSTIAKTLAKDLPMSKNDLYALILQIKKTTATRSLDTDH